jgi:hypothetical protein
MIDVVITDAMANTFRGRVVTQDHHKEGGLDNRLTQQRNHEQVPQHTGESKTNKQSNDGTSV